MTQLQPKFLSYIQVKDYFGLYENGELVEVMDWNQAEPPIAGYFLFYDPKRQDKVYEVFPVTVSRNIP